jgi:polyhydroxybutyrate depolymerase
VLGIILKWRNKKPVNQMNKILLGLLIFAQATLFSQQTINASLEHNGITRTYILYVPQGYTGDVAVPLVFNFHGYGSNAEEQYYYADFRTVADRENFLVVLPNGTVFNGNQHWDVGGSIFGSGTDDVGFTEALLDELSSNYNIDNQRVYATGMSNGGYMSFHLACQLPGRFAAIASVTGAMTQDSRFFCQVDRAFPVLQIHGTEDPVVPYDGAFWSIAIPEVLTFWKVNNDADSNPEIIEVPNINTFDQSTVEHQIWRGSQGITVEHFKVFNGEHTWPGAPIPLGVTNQDINACEEIWKFFNKYTLDGLVGTKAIEIDESITISPNPTSGQILIEKENDQPIYFQLTDLHGRILKSGQFNARSNSLDLGDLPIGMYLLKMGGLVKKVIKE